MNTFQKLALVLWLAAALSAPLGCRRASEDQTPIATVRHFLDAMERSADDENALREAYELLDGSARSALNQRAQRASELAGRPFQGWQMLAQGRFRLRIAPAARGGMRERVQGEHALVTVTGENAAQRAEVPLLREEGRWRLQLAVPSLRN